VYVANNIQLDKSMLSIIIDKGIASEDFPIWLLSMVLVRRLCVGDVSGSSQTTSLITFIYNFISQKVTGNNTGSYQGMVKVKEFESGDAFNDHNTSRLEGYKLKLEAPTGDISILEHYMSNPQQVALKVKPDIDLQLLNTFLVAAQALNNEQIWKPQITLAQYVLKSVMPPRGIPHLNKKECIIAIAIAQTVLWETNHKLLACMITAIATSNFDEMMLSGIDSRDRIPKEYMDSLNELFPFTKTSASKKKSKTPNSAVATIDELSNLFSQRDWILTVPDEFVNEVIGNKSIRRFSCQSDIKVKLAKLIIEVATK
jgi:hypothetical protein